MRHGLILHRLSSLYVTGNTRVPFIGRSVYLEFAILANIHAQPIIHLAFCPRELAVTRPRRMAVVRSRCDISASAGSGMTALTTGHFECQMICSSNPKPVYTSQDQ